MSKLAIKVAILKYLTWLFLITSVVMGGWTIHDISVKNELSSTK